MEAETVKSDVIQIQIVLKQHIDHINNIPEFKNSIKVFIPENNLGHEAAHMWHLIKKLRGPKLKVFHENGGEKMGVWKGTDTADKYRYTFGVKLHNDSIYFYEKFFTSSRKHTTTTIKALAKEQLERCQYSFEEPKTIYGKPKFTITGKIGGNQDDLSIAIQQCVFHGFTAINKPMYIQ